MLPEEVLQQIKRIEINTRKLVDSMFMGQYKTAFKGQGMTFADFREYVPGDDVRAISWPLTARTGKTFIKKFEEERELTILLCVDISGSTDFGSQKNFKGEIITYLSAVLAYAAIKNNDTVGLLLFTDRVEHYVPPRKGRNHVQRLLRDLVYFKPRGSGTNIGEVLRYVTGILKRKASVFIFSDFMDDDFDQAMRVLGRKHDIVAGVVTDPLETALPKMGLVEFIDPESGEQVLVDTSSNFFQRDFKSEIQKRISKRDRLLRVSQADRLDVSTDTDWVKALLAYFRKK
ncbi:MAG: DUF58 domain-containing protein [Bdellovibrionota bacterium]